MELAEEQAFCPLCGEVMDVFGDHALMCACGGDRTRRHHKLRNQAYFDAQAAGVPGTELERPGLLPARASGEGPPTEEPDGEGMNEQGRRPADVYVAKWRNGVPAALDFAVTSGMRAPLLTATIADPGEACDRYEEHKRQYLNTGRLCFDAGIVFIPMVVEAHGGAWGREARRAFAVVAQLAAEVTGEDVASVADRMAQRHSVSLHRENARAILKRLQRRRPGATPARLAAAGAVAAAQAD